MTTEKHEPREPIELVRISELDRIAPARPRKVGHLMEESYRRGFRNGYVIGLNALYDLMNDMDREMAHEIGWDFWLYELKAWKNGDCTRLILPPVAPGRE